MLDAVEQFRSALEGRGIIPPAEIIADGEIHRCKAQGRSGDADASYLLHLDGIAAGGFQNWTDGLGWADWREDVGRTTTPLEEQAHRAHVGATRKQREVEDQKRHAEARERAARIWQAASPCEEHPYLTKKGIRAHGASLAKEGHYAGHLVIPVKDSKGTIHTLQFIGPDGGKWFLAGGRKQGGYWSLGRPGPIIYICEGFATGASIYEAMGCGTVCAFDCGNLWLVATAIREKYPEAALVFCADDDVWTEGNPGKTKAMEAALAVGARVVIPKFGPDRVKGQTDFNDMHVAQGLDAVRLCIEGSTVEVEPEAGPLDDHLPPIMVRPPEDAVVNQALDALAKKGRLFQRGHQLVHVSAPPPSASQKEPPGPTIVPATGAWMRLELSQVAAFYRQTEEGQKRIMVPEWLPQLALEKSDFPGLPELFAIAETAVFLKDGTVHNTPGLDPSTGIFFAPLGNVPIVPDKPCLDDAKKAADTLFDLVSDFPFASDESRGAWLALLLTVSARFAIPGPVPFWLIDANGQSAGKGLLTQISSIITLGRDPVSVVASGDTEEFRKNVLCTLMDGIRFAWLDEAGSPFGGRRWNGLITATTYQDRILGSSKTWAGPHFTVWIASGNNVQLATDTPRRCVHVRLEPPEERPEDRGDFKIKDLVAHTKRHRVEFLGSALIILRAYHLAGRPSHGLTPWGSFEEWSRLIRECVYWCTGIDCDTRKELTATADTSRESSAVILELLETLFPKQKTFLASDLFTAYEAKNAGGWMHPHLREALDAINTSSKGVTARGLGNLLKARRNRNFAGRRLEGVTGGKHGMAYRIIPASEKWSGLQNLESPESAESPFAPQIGGAGESGDSDFLSAGEKSSEFNPVILPMASGDDWDNSLPVDV